MEKNFATFEETWLIYIVPVEGTSKKGKFFGGDKATKEIRIYTVTFRRSFLFTANR
jgi:hypothetical protein